MVALPKDFLRTEEGERIERRDYEHVAFETPRAILESVVNDLLIGTAADSGDQVPSNSVVSGFPVTADGTATPGAAGVVVYTNSGIVTVTRGVAIVGSRINGQVEFGLPLANGDLTRNIDISSLADGTYGAYIRLEFRDDEFQNRVFWNPLASTPVETTRNIATRRSENWAMAIEAVSPGAEWMLLATVLKAGTTLTITDAREMFFDVSTNDHDAEELTDADWGGGADRDADRRVNGVKGLYQLIKAFQRQIQDIIGGGDGWAQEVPVGGSLQSLLTTINNLGSTYLRRDGGNTMNSGSQLNWVDTTGIIGGTQKLDRIQSTQFEGANDFTTEAGAEREAFTAAFIDDQQVGADRCLIHEYAGFNDIGGGIFSSAGNEKIRIYAAGNGLNAGKDYLEFAFNAEWDEGTKMWTRGDDTSRASALIIMGPATHGAAEAVIQANYRPASEADTWDDTTSGSGWDRIWYVGPTIHTSGYGASACILGANAADISIFQEGNPETGSQELIVANNANTKEWFIPLNDIPEGATIESASVHFSAIAGSDVRVTIVRRPTLGSASGQAMKTGTAFDAIGTSGTTALTLDEATDVRTISGGTYTYYAWFSCEINTGCSFRGLEVTYTQGTA